MKLNKSLQELCSEVIVQHINKRNNIKHLEIPSHLKPHLFKIWKWHHMNSHEIGRRITEFGRKYPPYDDNVYRVVITRYSHEDHPPRDAGQWGYTIDPDYSYCFQCTNELNLSLEIEKCVQDLNKFGAAQIVGMHPYSSCGYCDNCMLPLYEMYYGDL